MSNNFPTNNDSPLIFGGRSFDPSLEDPENSEESGELEGGHKVTKMKEAIFPGGAKAVMVFAFLLAAALLTVTILAGHGVIDLSSHQWAFKLLEGLSGTIGSCQLLALPLIIGYYVKAKKVRDRAENMECFKEDSQTSDLRGRANVFGNNSSGHSPFENDN